MFSTLLTAPSFFSARKNFSTPFLANPILNRMGLHPWRVRLSHILAQWRARVYGPAGKLVDEIETLQEEGVLVWPDFCAPECFRAIKAQAYTLADTVIQARKGEADGQVVHGFGAKQHYGWGFERYDSTTLNRFITLKDKAGYGDLLEFAHDPRLSVLSKAVLGRGVATDKVWLYDMVFGNPDLGCDDQQNTHRDTFHPALKFWYFLDDVTLEQGPFAYSRASHILTPARCAWEKRMALTMIARPLGQRYGAFRASDEDLSKMEIMPPQPIRVKANTLIMANVFGFHRRMPAPQGTRRLSLYGNIRPHPFALL